MAIGESNPNYVFCKRCGKVRTSHPSGLCSKCARRNPVESKYCTICGSRKTNDPSGVCASCRRLRKNSMRGDTVMEATRLDEAILVASKNLRLLTMRKSGASFARIGHELGMSKASVYATYTRLIGSPMISIIDDDDDFIDVSPYRSQSTNAPPRLVKNDDDAG